MVPKLGDWVHFRTVCAACNKMGRQHFTSPIDDPELLSILPTFSKLLHTYQGGRKINIWWDHSPSLVELYKTKLDALLASLKAVIGQRAEHGYEDTRLIILGGEYVFFTEPSRNIIPLADTEVQNPRIAHIAIQMNLKHFNYIDLT